MFSIKFNNLIFFHKKNSTCRLSRQWHNLHFFDRILQARFRAKFSNFYFIDNDVSLSSSKNESVRLYLTKIRSLRSTNISRC